MARQLLCDSLIFDMDGTLWDAVDSYVKVWNTTLDHIGVPHSPVTRGQLLSLMGKHLEDITAVLAPELAGDTSFLETLDLHERSMMPRLGGVLYPGVKETIAKLAEKIPLFMVSNCGSYGLQNFMDYTGLRPYFTDTLTHGGSGLPKAGNIAVIVERNNLKHPIYVGDTLTDEEAAHQAGVKFIWCAYGFGTAKAPDATITSIAQLPALLDIAQ